MSDTDILDRLRTSRHKVPEHVIEPERREAADEIERLRAENQQAWNECEKNDEAKRHALAEIERLLEALAEITDLTLTSDERRSIAVLALGWDKF